MSGLFVGLVVTSGFLLGLRVGLALGRRNERRRLEERGLLKKL